MFLAFIYLTSICIYSVVFKFTDIISDTLSIFFFFLTFPYPGDCSVGVVVQEVGGEPEGLSAGVDGGQREESSRRVQQGPAVAKAARAAVNLPLVGHSHTEELVPTHLGRQVT